MVRGECSTRDVSKYSDLKITNGEKMMKLVRGEIDIDRLIDADTDGSSAEDGSPKSSVVSSSEHEGFEVVSEMVINTAIENENGNSRSEGVGFKVDHRARSNEEDESFEVSLTCNEGDESFEVSLEGNEESGFEARKLF